MINRFDYFYMEALFIKRYHKKELKSNPYKPTNKKYSNLKKINLIWKSLKERHRQFTEDKRQINAGNNAQYQQRLTKSKIKQQL